MVEFQLLEFPAPFAYQSCATFYTLGCLSVTTAGITAHIVKTHSLVSKEFILQDHRELSVELRGEKL